jgi:hypothetical protein
MNLGMMNYVHAGLFYYRLPRDFQPSKRAFRSKTRANCHFSYEMLIVKIQTSSYSVPEAPSSHPQRDAGDRVCVFQLPTSNFQLQLPASIPV